MVELSESPAWANGVVGAADVVDLVAIVEILDPRAIRAEVGLRTRPTVEARERAYSILK